MKLQNQMQCVVLSMASRVSDEQCISKKEPYVYNCVDLGAKETWENKTVQGFLYFLSLHSVPNPPS